MSKFYYYKNNNNNDGKKNISNENEICISFMIFRTGSVLIVGKCETINIINEIYTFIKNIFKNEYLKIYLVRDSVSKTPIKKKKNLKKKKIVVYK